MRARARSVWASMSRALLATVISWSRSKRGRARRRPGRCRRRRRRRASGRASSSSARLSSERSRSRSALQLAAHLGELGLGPRALVGLDAPSLAAGRRGLRGCRLRGRVVAGAFFAAVFVAGPAGLLRGGLLRGRRPSSSRPSSPGPSWPAPSWRRPSSRPSWWPAPSSPAAFLAVRLLRRAPSSRGAFLAARLLARAPSSPARLLRGRLRGGRRAFFAGAFAAAPSPAPSSRRSSWRPALGRSRRHAVDAASPRPTVRPASLRAVAACHEPAAPSSRAYIKERAARRCSCHTRAARICRTRTPDNQPRPRFGNFPRRRVAPANPGEPADPVWQTWPHRTAWTGRVAPSTAGSDPGTVRARGCCPERRSPRAAGRTPDPPGAGRVDPAAVDATSGSAQQHPGRPRRVVPRERPAHDRRPRPFSPAAPRPKRRPKDQP